MGRPVLAFVVAVAAFALPAAAQAQPRLAGERPLASSNVEPLATLPVPHPIGARFRDGFMYVTTTEGLTVYDVTKPELPVPVGALALPHFENEDVDLGGNILLSSNDPSEGVGVLYVIDIANPRAPVLKSPGRPARAPAPSRPGGSRASGPRPVPASWCCSTSSPPSSTTSRRARAGLR